MFKLQPREAVKVIGVSVSLGLINLGLTLMSGYVLTHLALLPTSQTRLLLGLLTVFIIGVSLLSYYHERCMQWLQVNHTKTALTQSCSHLLALSPVALADVGPGELMQQLSHQVNGIGSTLSAASELIFTALSLIGLLFVFFWVSFAQLFILLPLMMLSLLVKSYLLKKRLSIHSMQLHQQTHFTRWLTEVIGAIAKVRSSGMGDTVYRRGMRYLLALKLSLKSLTQLQMLTTAWDSLFALGLMLLVMQQASVAWLPLLLMVSQLSAMLDRFSMAFMKAEQGQQMSSHIQPLLHLPLPETNHKIQTIPEAAQLCFHEVSYLPAGTKVPLIHKLSFTLNPGEFLALTGPSGAGKSTVLRLALGLLSPSSGKITLNGIELHHYDMPAWRRAVGAVLQTSQLTNGSLYRAMAGNSGITLEEAWALAEVVGLADAIRAMPMGMQTLISDRAGESLSGGQRQKCLLARALAQKPRWLFLDEATSQLDNHSEARVQAYLSAMRITRLVVAHRESSVRQADRRLQLNSLTGLAEAPGFPALNSYSIPLSQIASG